MSNSGSRRFFLYERMFEILDEDKDGRISMLDIQRPLRWVGQDEDNDTLKKIFQNQSNLTFEEFLRSVECEEKDKKVNGLHKEFRKYSEKDDVGRGIRAKDLRKMLSKLGVKRTTQQCVNMIRSFYPNGDDVINFEEFEVLRFFSTFPERVEYSTEKQNYRPVGSCGPCGITCCGICMGWQLRNYKKVRKTI